MEDLNRLAKEGSVRYAELMAECQTKLQEAIDSAIEEAEAQDVRAKLRINFSTTLDLDERLVEYALCFGMRYKASVESELYDPGQMQFQGLGDETEKVAEGADDVDSVPDPVREDGHSQLSG